MTKHLSLKRVVGGLAPATVKMQRRCGHAMMNSEKGRGDLIQIKALQFQTSWRKVDADEAIASV
jgi:hypothetical protein